MLRFCSFLLRLVKFFLIIFVLFIYVGGTEHMPRISLSGVLDFPRKTLSEDIWRYASSEGKEKHNELPRLKPDLRSIILMNADKYLRSSGLCLEESNLYGGSASYQWSKGADIDVSLYASGWPENITQEEIEKRQNFFKEIEVEYYGMPIHFYLKPPQDQDIEVSDAVYNIVYDGWVLPPLILPQKFNPEEYFKPFIKIAEEKAKKIDLEVGRLRRSWKILKKAYLALDDKAESPEIVDDQIEKEKRIIRGIVKNLAKSFVSIRNRRYALHDKLKEKIMGGEELKGLERFQEPEIVWKYLDLVGYTDVLHKIYKINENNWLDKMFDKIREKN